MSEPVRTTAFDLPADHVLHRVQSAALVVAGVGVIACVVGLFAAREQFFQAYLIAYLFFIGLALGSMAVLMIQYVTGGAWGAVIRRLLESATRTLPLMALLFLPIAFGLTHLYEWAIPEHVAHDPILQHKSLYLNVPFFLGRAVFYFVAWLTTAYFLNRWSLEQDAGADPRLTRRLEMLSRGGLLLYAFTMTFASMDWGMSLEPHWFSTIYGVMFMGQQGLSTFAFMIPMAALLAARPPFSRIIGADQFHDLGKLMLAFVMLWAYFAFSQFLIIWSANLPEEIPWYLRRTQHGWQWVALVLFVIHFALPFIVLLSRDVKRHARAVSVVAVLLIAARFVDLFWLLRPAVAPEGFAIHWLDPAAIAAVGGMWMWLFVAELKTRPMLPLNDPAIPVEA
ncbi:MAG: hypothetical protein ABIR79_17675 [Candidatus Binatia bacterium]